MIQPKIPRISSEGVCWILWPLIVVLSLWWFSPMVLNLTGRTWDEPHGAVRTCDHEVQVHRTIGWTGWIIGWLWRYGYKGITTATSIYCSLVEWMASTQFYCIPFDSLLNYKFPTISLFRIFLLSLPISIILLLLTIRKALYSST